MMLSQAKSSVKRVLRTNARAATRLYHGAVVEHYGECQLEIVPKHRKSQVSHLISTSRTLHSLQRTLEMLGL